MKNLYTEIEFFVLDNRSLAENNPLNLIGRGCTAIDTYLDNYPVENFVDLVQNLLDKNE